MQKCQFSTLLHFLTGKSAIIAVRSVLCLFLVQILNYGIITGQTAAFSSRKDIIEKQLKMFSSIHDSLFDHKKNLINGKVFYPGGNEFVHPFYGDNSWKPASIYSTGAVYKTDLVKYDIHLDYLVLLHSTDSLSFPIYLNRSLVNEFDIYGHRFKYIDDFAGPDNDLVAGYYEVEDYGKSRLLIRRIKTKIFDNYSLSETYSDRAYYFVNIDGKYIKLVRRNSLIKILNDHRKEVKAYMKNNNLRFSRENYDQAGKVLKYYETL